MGKRKPPRNAFFYFMLDFKNKHSISSMVEASNKAGEVWQKMSAAAKQPYQDRAKREKGGVKLNCLGQNVNILSQEKKRQEEEEMLIKKTVSKMIDVAAETNTLQDQVFHLVHVHHYFYYSDWKKFFPAEIGIVAFNLREGIQDTYHKIITPKSIPVGYTLTLKENGNAYHKITIDPDAPPTDMKVVCNEILRMLKKNDEVKSELYPLYATTKLMPTAQSIFEDMAIDADLSESTFKFCPVEYLFFILRNAVSPSKATFPSVGVATLELEKDIFEFKEGLSCPFHETTDSPQLCSLSIVHRNMYAICNHCCQDLGLQLIPGQHVPTDAVIYPTAKLERVDTKSEIASQSMSIYGDDDISDSDYPEVQYSEDQSNIDSDGEFTLVQRGRHHHNQYSRSSSSQSKPATIRFPSSQSMVFNEDTPCYGRGRGRGRGTFF